jgi:general secretion pathway protein C
MLSPLIVRRSMPAVLLTLVGVAAALQARGVSLLIGDALASRSPPVVAVAPQGEPAQAPTFHHTSSEGILARSPLDSTMRDLLPAGDLAPGDAPAPAELPADPYAAPPCEGMRVLATAVVSDVASSFAILASAPEPGGARALVRQGDVLGGQRVWLVARDRVWLWSSRGLCQAGPEMPPPGATPGASPREQARAQAQPQASGLVQEIISRIKRVGPGELVVDRAAIDRVRDGFGEIARTTRFLPEFDNGKPLGVRMMAVKPGTLWEALGLQSGDRIEKINGFEVGSPESMLQAYGKLTTADELSVELSRGGKRTLIEVHIR